MIALNETIKLLKYKQSSLESSHICISAGFSSVGLCSEKGDNDSRVLYTLEQSHMNLAVPYKHFIEEHWCVTFLGRKK